MTPEDLLTQGLQDNFAGKADYGKQTIAGIPFKTAMTEDGSNIHLDTWADARVTAGLEVANSDIGKISRSYSGGIIDKDKLIEIGTNEDAILKTLAEVIKDYGDKIRLYNDFILQIGEFKYEYKVIYRDPDISITTGKEKIYFNDKVVFVHSFLISPIIEN